MPGVWNVCGTGQLPADVRTTWFSMEDGKETDTYITDQDQLQRPNYQANCMNYTLQSSDYDKVHNTQPGVVIAVKKYYIIFRNTYDIFILYFYVYFI